MHVMIGIDPHKASHTAVAIDEREEELASVKVRATKRQVEQLLTWAERFDKRTWAVESAGGMGYLLSQQLLGKGEVAVDVSATLSSRVRVLATGRSSKNDPNDALSVAVAALRAPRLCAVSPADHAEVLRLLAKRNTEIGNLRNRVVCRLHAMLIELAPGGIAKEINASDVDAFLARLRPKTPVQRLRHELVTELLEELRRLDAQLKVSHPDPRRRQGLWHLGHRDLRCRTDHRGRAHRLQRRRRALCQPRRLRRLQRHRARRVLLRWPGHPPGVRTRQPHAQPRHPHGRHLPDPPDRLGRPALLPAPGRRGKDEA